MKLVVGISAFLMAFLLNACATSGVQQIQKKCKNVEGLTETYVCEQP
jgi:hypothetical protein